jgi:hypothetical protein
MSVETIIQTVAPLGAALLLGGIIEFERNGGS